LELADALSPVRRPARFRTSSSPCGLSSLVVFTNDEPGEHRERAAETAAEQAARVQLLYRQVNERIQSVGAGIFGMAADEPLSIVCECLDPSCVKRVEISAYDLGRLRSSPAVFIVLPGHETPENEEVLERHDGFLVVVKDAALVERMQERMDDAHDESEL
jgi:hypothetical protein